MDKRYILVIDVGNTNMTFGVYEKDELKASFRIMTKVARTSDEYGIEIRTMLRVNHIDCREIGGSVVSSVVPNVMHALMACLYKYLGLTPYVVGPGIKTGIKICMENPKEVGPDLIVDAVAAFEKYGGPIMIIDFGSATTYEIVNENGEFFTGIISPGISMCAKALWQDTAKLPEVEIVKPKTILGRETITSMQAGLVYGQIGQTKYIINKMREESGLYDMKVVATGGLGKMISEEVEEIDYYEKNLTLDGLRIIFEKNEAFKQRKLREQQEVMAQRAMQKEEFGEGDI